MAFADLLSKRNKAPADVVGIDFGGSATKVVRLHRNADQLFLDGVEQLPAFSTDEPSFSVPPKLKARYAALATSVPTATAKLLTFPGAIDASVESTLGKNLGIHADDDCRVSYRIVSEGSGRTESRVLAAALPEADAAVIMAPFHAGLPAPSSLELSPLAALTAFEAGPVKNESTPAVGLVDFGTQSSTLSIFYKKSLVLLRRIDFGTRKLLDRVISTLHIDNNTALNILSDNAFDISELITEIMSPLSSQLIVSRDFVERRENCTLNQLHCIGGLTESPAAMQELERALGTKAHVFDPFAMLNTSPLGNVDQISQHWRFTAAIGAALGALVEEP